MGRPSDKAFIRVSVLALAAMIAIALFPFAGCGSTVSSLDPPDSILVYSDGAESSYAEGEREYDAAFNLLKGTRLDAIMETAIDPEMAAHLKEGNCIEFVYDDPRRTNGESQGGSIAREYDRLLFCFNEPIAGEVVLGFDGQYLSGTYKMNSATWPF